MKNLRLIIISGAIFVLSTNVSILFAWEQDKGATIEILNPEYTKPANVNDNVDINTESSVEDILKKVEYYYANQNFDKAIELLEIALQKTSDRELVAKINFSLSSNYLEKGTESYRLNKDESFYKLSIQFAKKSLEVIPDNWQALANMGSIYLNMGDYKQAASYFLEAEKYVDKNDPNYAALEYHRNLAEEMGKGK